MELAGWGASGRTGELELWEIDLSNTGIRWKKTANSQVFNLTRVNRLRTSTLINSLGDIGKFSTVQRLVNLNASRKRMWFEDLKDVNDRKMSDSLPISMIYLKNGTSNTF